MDLDIARRVLHLPFVPGLSLPCCVQTGDISGDTIGDVSANSGAGAGFQPVPDRQACEALWDRYAMPQHIRNHSIQVAAITITLGELLAQRGVRLSLQTLLAGALLHDIAKIYSVHYPGDHAQTGAAIAVRETHNYLIGQMVYHHVGWPWAVDIYNEQSLHALLLDYADKRVRHDQIVTLEERFADLRQRYGRSERSLAMIEFSRLQGYEIEKALSERLEVSVNEYPFDSGRLVP
jgi:putative nucleotidyltransferase with HDIG domain